MSSITEITPDDLMTIDEVLSKWPRYFTANELNEAMKGNRISYVRKGRGRLLTRAGIGAYLLNQTVNSGSGQVSPRAAQSLATRPHGKFDLVLGSPPKNVGVDNHVSITSILQHYWETHSDATPSAFQARRAGGLLLEWLVDVREKPAATVVDFSTPWQQEFIKWLADAKDHAVATITREMCIILAAINHAAKRIVIDENGDKREVQFLKDTVSVIYKEKDVSRISGKPESIPRDWVPTWEQTALFIDTIGRQTSKGKWNKNSENLFRYVAVALNTWARPEAVLELHVPTQVDFESGLVRLNPPHRKQTKKVRPTILLTDNLSAILKEWNCDRPVHRNGVALKSIKKVFRSHAINLGMPKFTPYTLRHFMATNIRRMEGCNVTREQRQEWLGHKPQDMTGWYEHFDPEWLREAKIGTDKIIERLNGLLKIRSLIPVFPRANISDAKANGIRKIMRSVDAPRLA